MVDGCSNIMENLLIVLIIGKKSSWSSCWDEWYLQDFPDFFWKQIFFLSYLKLIKKPSYGKNLQTDDKEIIVKLSEMFIMILDKRI